MPTRALDGHLCVIFKHQVLDQLICLGKEKEIFKVMFRLSYRWKGEEENSERGEVTGDL